MATPNVADDARALEAGFVAVCRVASGTVPSSDPRTPRREELRALLAARRDVHVYGLADLEEPFWSRSHWYRRGDAVIGDVGLTDDPDDRAVYGIAVDAPDDTVELWVEIDDQLPERYFATGPIGFVDRLCALGRTAPFRAPEQLKMTLVDPDAVTRDAADAPDGASVRSITHDDLSAIDRLQRRRVDPGAYFAASLLDDGPFVGVFEGDELSAMAGIHVCSVAAGVAAVGNVLVSPDRRGAGLGRIVTAGVCRELMALGIGTIGLNVSADNAPALAVYRRLGFEVVHRFEEALLVRGRPGGTEA